MKLSEEQEIIADLVAWELLRKEYQTDMGALVSEALLKLEEKEPFLTMRSGYERAIWILAGGPASGKQSIFNTKVKKQVIKKQPYAADKLVATPEAISGLLERIQDKDEDVRREAAGILVSMNMATPEGLLKALEHETIDACNMNVDIFKPLLLEPGKGFHAARTHEESSHIRDLALKKLENMLAKTEKAPHIVWDHPDLKALDPLLKDSPKINLYVTTCPVLDVVEGNRIIRGSVGRAFDRASKANSPAHGSYAPASTVLDGHKKVSASFPSLVSSGRYSSIALYDTTTQKPKKVCHLEGQALRIDNFTSFIEFVKNGYINTKAYSPGTVYSIDHVINCALKPEHIASSVAEYLKTGIRLNYGQHTTLEHGLLSRNLSLSLSDFTKDLNDKAKSESLLEALMMDLLGSYNLKDTFPILLKDAKEKEISIFSDEIEQEGYLPKGSVFKFLRCISQNILKAKKINISTGRLDEASRDILKVMVAKQLPRDEAELIKHLPQLIQSALYPAKEQTQLIESALHAAKR
jgi:hypothetical protein